MKAANLKQELAKFVNPEKAAHFPKFFKTEKGQYGEGDKFIGVTVPNQRKVAKQYIDISLKQLQDLLQSEIHEYRLTALLVLVYKWQRAKTEAEHEQLYEFYLNNLEWVNNWDLVDTSADKLIGGYLYKYNKDRKIIYKLANSGKLWQERIAILATYFFIKNDDFADILKLSEKFLSHKHDLIHKATGWMLREMGKRDLEPLLEFLDKHTLQMPRTMLRYSIEKLPEAKRKYYLNLGK